MTIHDIIQRESDGSVLMKLTDFAANAEDSELEKDRDMLMNEFIAKANALENIPQYRVGRYKDEIKDCIMKAVQTIEFTYNEILALRATVRKIEEERNLLRDAFAKAMGLTFNYSEKEEL